MAEKAGVPAAVAMFDNAFADNMWALRVRLGLSRRDLADITGISQRVIEKIETGGTCRNGLRRRPTIGEAVVIAEALGVRPGELLKHAAVADA